jgi:hypothetical protein
MIHIRQKNSSIILGEVYAIVITTDWNKPLEEHPSIIERPDFFEIVDCEIPNYIQYVNYISDGN